MKTKLLSLALVLFSLSSCVAPEPLYYWGNYEKTSYNYLSKADEESIAALLETYQTLIERQTGLRQQVPPGLYADYGFLLLQEGRTAEGEEMLAKEMTLYPESKIFIDRILNMLEE